MSGASSKHEMKPSRRLPDERIDELAKLARNASRSFVRDLLLRAVEEEAALQLEKAEITDNDKRWRILEHGCQWVSWTPTGGETVSFDPRDVKYLKAMRASADATIEKQLALLRAEAHALERRRK